MNSISKLNFNGVSYDFSFNCQFEYMENEEITNNIWIDGKPIYVSVFKISSLPNSNLIRYKLPFTFECMVEASIFAIDSKGYSFTPIPTGHMSTNESIYVVFCNNFTNDPELINTVGIRTGKDMSTYSATMVLRYTKP